MYDIITLLPKKDEAVRRFHPWIFSGAIKHKPTQLVEGQIVEVQDTKGQFLAIGHYYSGSIAIKILSFEKRAIDQDFWHEKIEEAWLLRKHLFDLKHTNAFRLSHGEGDGLPGLILDYYHGVVVFQAHSMGMWQAKESIKLALETVLGQELTAIFDKSKDTLPKVFSEDISNQYLLEKREIALPHSILENGHQFLIDWHTGQKTGFFLDQRENRHLLSTYAKGKAVLNTFCYSGGFSIYALAQGALSVHSVDASKNAIALVESNVALNFGSTVDHKAYVADVMAFMREHSSQYDIVVVDPPAYAKNIGSKHAAVQGYKRLNAEAIKHTASNGLIFTFSCSQVISKQLFQDTIVAAALEVGRKVRILHHLTQGADHPTNLFHPEGSYLKGLVLKLD